jgi:hypothetical protein
VSGAFYLGEEGREKRRREKLFYHSEDMKTSRTFKTGSQAVVIVGGITHVPIAYETANCGLQIY